MMMMMMVIYDVYESSDDSLPVRSRDRVLDGWFYYGDSFYFPMNWNETLSIT